MMRIVDEEVFLLTDKESALIYFPIRGYVGEVSFEMAENIKVKNVIKRSDLDQNKILKQIYLEACSNPRADLDVMKRGFPELNIDLSTGCNMHCIYCYAERGVEQVKYQTKANIDLILKTYFQSIGNLKIDGKGQKCRVVFSNDAEPTFSPELLKYAVLKAVEIGEQVKIKPSFSMPSNCGFDASLMPLILEYFDHISCSFDGLPWVQELHRPLVNGQSSFEKVFQNINQLYKNKIKLSFNIVVTRHNLHFLKETILFFNTHFKGTHISFSQVLVNGRAQIFEKELQMDQSLYDQFLGEAIEFAKDKEIRVMDKHSFNIKRPRRHYCSSTARPNWNVSLSGGIYACMEAKNQTMKMGAFDFEKGICTLDEFKIEQLGLMNVDEFSKCTDCFAKYLCAGSCIANREKTAMRCDGIRERCLQMIQRFYINSLRLKAKRLFEL